MNQVELTQAEAHQAHVWELEDEFNRQQAPLRRRLDNFIRRDNARNARRNALRQVLDFVEAHNKKDKDNDVAEAAALLQPLIERGL